MPKAIRQPRIPGNVQHRRDTSLSISGTDQVLRLNVIRSRYRCTLIEIDVIHECGQRAMGNIMEIIHKQRKARNFIIFSRTNATSAALTPTQCSFLLSAVSDLIHFVQHQHNAVQIISKSMVTDPIFHNSSGRRQLITGRPGLAKRKTLFICIPDVTRLSLLHVNVCLSVIY